MPPQADSQAAALPGVRAELKARASLAGGRPALTERYHTAPLKIAKSFDLASPGGEPQLAVVQMDVSPGLLDGDRYLYDWTVGAGVRLYATNQAYTRVHPCPSSDARVETRLRIERDAALEWMPEPILLFKEAKYAGSTEIELESGAVAIVSDLVCPGRLARGESFEYASYDAKLAVRLEGELIHYQRQRWIPAELPLRSPGCFGDCTHIASLSAFSDRIEPSLADEVAGRLEREDVPPEVRWTVARTARHGLVVQMAGNRTWPLQRLTRQAWGAIRGLLLGSPPPKLFADAQ
ncbi:hypothetical protein J19TS2_31490 [Cohnella xylanilytica]|uniref:urease accessory protein UreD n=1 Tax=Cohnella xylanilytica TaxID=557555 RepID=UPI001B2B9C6D|nr:urease accessory protein UreD [Cohnella xylanilytica]GIO13594.1 hypothetical protein J19TS2_31490 [Cohnella xylanilytica]